MTYLETDRLVTQSKILIADANHAGAAFCLVDLDMAHTMLDRADVSTNRVVRERNIGNARVAHDAIQSLRPRLHLDDPDAHAVDEAMQRLEKRLANYS